MLLPMDEKLIERHLQLESNLGGGEIDALKMFLSRLFRAQVVLTGAKSWYGRH